MSLTKKGQSFPYRITDKIIADKITAALRQEHANLKTPLKLIERVTGIPADTVNKWYKKGYAPKSRHLLVLASHYPQVLQAICELMGRRDLWQEIVRLGLVESMYAKLEEIWQNWKLPHVKVDKSVHIHVRLDAKTAVHMNQRQLWFLGQLQQGYQMQVHDIESTWHVHLKTAKRDLSGLIKAKLITPEKAGKTIKYNVI